MLVNNYSGCHAFTCVVVDCKWLIRDIVEHSTRLITYKIAECAAQSTMLCSSLILGQQATVIVTIETIACEYIKCHLHTGAPCAL